MSARILIVEDEILVAADMEATIEDLGYVSCGIAPDTETALELSEMDPDLALVDLNLRDGATGAQIGAMLGARGVAVVFVTANPRMVRNGVPGTFGVVGKPCGEASIGAVIAYALRRRRGEDAIPPRAMSIFDHAVTGALGTA